MPSDGVPILMYHSLDDSGSVISVPPRHFRRHMEILGEKGYTGIGLGQLIDGWDGTVPLPDRPVVITFDDGFVNNLECAVPALREMRFGATIYAVAGRLGQDNAWATQPPSVPVMGLMTADQLRQCRAAGIEIGAHTMSHGRLDRLPDPQAETEIVTSKRALEDVLGAPVRTFAYTYGAANDFARRIAAREFRASVSVEMGLATPRCPREFLPRLDVYYLRDPRLFRRLGTPAGSLYLAARKAGRDLRGLLTGGVP